MLKTRFVFAVSVIAMMAVVPAWAEIAGVSYVDKGVQAATTAAGNAQTSATNAQNSANAAKSAADAAQESADAAAASAKTANDAVATKQAESTAEYQMGNASGGWTTMTTQQKNALNSGITSDKVSTYDGYATTIAGKQNALGYTAENSANKLTKAQGITNNKTSDTKYPTAAAVVDYVDSTIDIALDDTADAVVQNTTDIVALTTTVNNNKTAADTGIQQAKTAAANAQSTADKAVVANAAITAGTGTKITYDAKGLVTGSASLAATDIPTLAISKINGLQAALDGKQATLTTSNIKGAGSVSVGISNGVITVTGTDNDTKYTLPAAGSSLGGAKTGGDLSFASGAGTIVNDAVTSAKIADGAIVNADIATDAAIAQSKISGLTTDLAAKVAIAQGKGTDNANVGKVLKVDSDGNLALAADNDTKYTVNNATLTIQKNGASVGTFTANASAAKTINITVPTGELASKNAVGSSEITDGTIVNADIATDAKIAISKIDGLQTALDGKQAKMTVDSALSSTSTNPVQNKVINSALAGKQATLTTSNIKGAGSVSIGIADGVITVTGTDNNTTYSTGNGTTSGLTKLYAATGTATDGTMTQKAISDSLAGKLSTTGTAAKATADAEGNNIVSTYATKTEMNDAINGAVDGVAGDLIDSINTKQDILTAGTNISISGSTISSTYSYTLPAASSSLGGAKTGGDLSFASGAGTIVSGAVTSAKIADGAVATADIAGSAVTTAKIAAGAVTAAKTSGVIGSIPSGSQTSTTYANIWVE